MVLMLLLLQLPLMLLHNQLHSHTDFSPDFYPGRSLCCEGLNMRADVTASSLQARDERSRVAAVSECCRPPVRCPRVAGRRTLARYLRQTLA